MLAYSGGADSTFLLKVAADTLGDKVLAVTAVSATYPEEELAFSRKMARMLGGKHLVVRTAELKDKQFSVNPINRCYFCKRELFNKLRRLAILKKFNFVIDAGNVSDKADFRPGTKAREELGVRSPLIEAGFTKNDIRKFSKAFALPTWDKPNLACLASRVPYGIRITPKLLSRINKTENLLRGLGFRQVRARHHDGLCRIEVFRGEIPRLISKSKLIVDGLKDLGYNYITVDLEGYRVGSMNPDFSKRKKSAVNRNGRAR